jgi:hypothetical protein
MIADLHRIEFPIRRQGALQEIAVNLIRQLHTRFSSKNSNLRLASIG